MLLSAYPETKKIVVPIQDISIIEMIEGITIATHDSPLFMFFDVDGNFLHAHIIAR
jgi:hypothetical protein